MTYTGAFLQNLKHGFGIEKSSAGQLYSGEFDQELRTGMGYLKGDDFEYLGGFLKGEY